MLLFCGIGFYLSVRCPDQIWFIQTMGLPSFYNQCHSVFSGSLNDNLPSLIHTFSFSLLTTGFWPSQDKKTFITACFSWSAVNILFEIGQLMPVDFALGFPDTKTDIIVDMVLNYCRHGTFDWMDIVYTLAGGGLAYSFLVTTSTYPKNGLKK